MNKPQKTSERILENCSTFIKLPTLSSQSIMDFMPQSFHELNTNNVTPEKIILVLDEVNSLFKSLAFNHIPFAQKYSPLVIKHLISQGESLSHLLPDDFFSNIKSDELDNIIEFFIEYEEKTQSSSLAWNTVIQTVAQHPKSMVVTLPKQSSSIMSGSVSSIMPCISSPSRKFSVEDPITVNLPKHLDLFLKIVKHPAYYEAYSKNFSEFQNLEKDLTLDTIKALLHFKIAMDMKKEIQPATQLVKVSKF